MHVPDGFLNAPTSLATGAIAATAVAVSLRKAEVEIRRTGPALAGLTAAFVFAVQMVNFPVGAGTSGHLMGGALTAALVGPWTAVLCMTVVLVVQAVLFADGGLTALGTNIVLIAVVTVLVGYLVPKAILAFDRGRHPSRHRGRVVVAVALGAFLSVPAAAAVFTACYSLGGTVEVPWRTLAAAMIGWHTVIGIGEAVITASVLGAVLAARPDLVRIAARRAEPLILVDADGSLRTVVAETAAPPATRPQARPARTFWALAAAVCLAVAGLVSLIASQHPDGLEFVGSQLGFESSAQPSAVHGSPVAEYQVVGLEGPLATSLAGVLGVLVVVALAMLVARIARRSAPAPVEAPVQPEVAAATRPVG